MSERFVTRGFVGRRGARRPGDATSRRGSRRASTSRPTSPCCRPARRRGRRSTAGRSPSRASSASRSRWTWEEFLALPTREWTVDISCVTKWTKLDMRWRGVSVDTLLEQVDLDPAAAFVIADSRRRLHHEPAARRRPQRPGVRRLRVRRRAARARARRPGPARRARALLLEEREVDPRAAPPTQRRARLLGVARLPQPRRPVARRALQRRLRDASDHGRPHRLAARDRQRHPRRDADGPVVHARRAGLGRAPARPARRPAADGRGRLQRRAQLLDRVRAGAGRRDRHHGRADRRAARSRRSSTRWSSSATGSRSAARSAATSSGRRRSGGPLLLVAGGSGVVPLMAMLRHRARAGSRVPTRLLFSSRHSEEVIYREELDRWPPPATGSRSSTR